MNAKVLDFEDIKNPLEKIDEIYEFRKSIKDPEVHKLFVNRVREAVQREAVEAIEKGPANCMVIMATGAGKTKVAIDYAISKKWHQQCLLVPTEKLRDVNWQEEYKKWDAEDLGNATEKYCYASASNVKHNVYDLVILDEGHNITENNSEFFYNNIVKKSILLTATKPDYKKDFAKYELIKKLEFEVVYEITLDQAVKLGFVAPYDIHVIEVPLDSSNKNIVGGSKLKPFKTTELSMYGWLNTSVRKMLFAKKNATFMIMKRMRFIYDLPSKEEAAKNLMLNFIPEKDRGLIFASGIEQAERLCNHTFHSKSSDESYKLFKEGKIDRLSCVKSLNEGHNFDNLDFALIVQLTSKEKDLIQRIGRILRLREGHKAKIFILVAVGTQDEVWLKKAIENLDQNSITHHYYKNIDKSKFYEN